MRLCGLWLLVVARAGLVAGTLKDLKLRSITSFTQDGLPLYDKETLVVTWTPELDADLIAVFETSSTPPNLQREFSENIPVMMVNPGDYPHGYLRTNLTFVEDTLPKGWNRASQETIVYGDACLDYWAAAYKAGKLLQADCLKIRPTWMSDHRDVLNNVSVASLFYGSGHHIVRYEDKYWPVAVERGGFVHLNRTTKVWKQLVGGVRFFSLDYERRINESEDAINALKEKNLYSNATLVDAENCPTLFGQFMEMKDFLMAARDEILVIDVKYSPASFDNKELELLLELGDDLQLALEDYIISAETMSYNSTLADVWAAHRNVIVTLDGVTIPYDMEWMWKPFPDIRGGNLPSDSVQEFLKSCVYTEYSTRMTAYLFRNLSYIPAIDTLGNPEKEILKLYPIQPDSGAENITTPAYVGNTLTDLPMIACLDCSNNVIFLAVEEDELP